MNVVEFAIYGNVNDENGNVSLQSNIKSKS